MEYYCDVSFRGAQRYIVSHKTKRKSPTSYDTHSRAYVRAHVRVRMYTVNIYIIYILYSFFFYMTMYNCSLCTRVQVSWIQF